MYEHPMKRAGLSYLRILFSNAKAISAGFPKESQQNYSFHFYHKTTDKLNRFTKEYKTEKNLDDLFPSTKKDQ